MSCSLKCLFISSGSDDRTQEGKLQLKGKSPTGGNRRIVRLSSLIAKNATLNQILGRDTSWRVVSLERVLRGIFPLGWMSSRSER